jgi:hypothetical protein
MRAATLQAEVFILGKQPPADSFQTFQAFSGEIGNLVMLQRVSKRAAQTVALDLFDEAAVAVETSNQGRTYFVKEARLLNRRVGIGRSYEALRFASALASLVARNDVHEESRAGVASLLRTAFAAFETSERPDIVYFKGVYRFARDEGYPLKEEWFPTLPAADRTAVTALLNKPLAEQNEAAESVTRLQRRLEEYLQRYTEIYIGPQA